MDGAALIDRLCEAGKDRQLIRRLQRYTVQVSDWHLGRLLASGDIVEPRNLPRTFVQASTALYQDDVGLCFPERTEAYSSSELII